LELKKVAHWQTLVILIGPRLRGQWNRWKRATSAERGTAVLFGLLGLAFWISIFVLFGWLIGSFHEVEVFGPILSKKLMELLMLGLFGLLCFSNVVTALSTYYLSDDLELVLSLPVLRASFHYGRLLETLVQSSWMVLVFGLPIFSAYGMAYAGHASARGVQLFEYGGPVVYAAVVVLVVSAFVVLAASIGVTVASLLVSLFPAKRIREAMMVMGILALVFVFVLLRFLRPERLANAESFESVAAYVAEMQTPVPLLAPPRWASDTLLAALGGRPFPWTEMSLLVLAAIGFAGISRWVTTLLFDRGRTRTQESRSARFAVSGWFDRFLELWVWPLPEAARPIVIKDMKSFVRDPAQWSQLLLVGSIVAISLASVAALPMDVFRGPWMVASRNVIAFLVLGLVGFVMSAVSGRFQFTAVSAEARAFWLIRSGPVTPMTVLLAKVWPTLIPMIVVGEVLAVASTGLLGAGQFMIWLSAGTAFFLALGISGLGVGLGAIYPDFKADNVARVASGPAGVLFMVAASSLVLLVIGMEAVPVWLVMESEFRERPLTGLQWAAVGGCLTIAAGSCLLVAWVSLKIGARRLWSRELVNG